MKSEKLVSHLGQTVGESKADKLVSKALDEIDADNSEFGEEVAEQVLEQILEISDDSLVSVAANTTMAQLIH